MTDRTAWVGALNMVPTDELLLLTAQLSCNWNVRPKSVPQAGLGMLKMNDSAFDEPFYLGEFPIASAWIEVQTNNGMTAEGAAQIMDDRVEIAEALALCDAVLANQLPGWERVSQLLEKGLSMRDAVRLERKQMLAATRVDFSLLDTVGDEHVES